MKSSCLRSVAFAALLMAGNVGAATFLVTTNANSGAGSLRQAIFDANTAGGANTIAFNIAGGGVKTIFIDTALTPLTSPATIDGYTQPGASSNTLAIGNNAVLLIEVTTTNFSQGIGLQASGCTVRGLVINGFFQGITCGITGPTGVVEGCFIGTDATGTNASSRANDIGILCQNGANRIGGTNPWQRNVIAGNNVYGIDTVNGLASNNVIVGNYIGTDKTGTKAIPNPYGIIAEAPHTQIKSNVVSGNQQFGIFLISASNVVEGCYVGTDPTGTTAVPNGGANVGGISVDITGNRIGGTNAAARNIISGNFGFGVNARPGATNSILGNFIGVDVTGTNALPNTSTGVNVRQTTGIIVSNNVISGNLGSGISLVQATRCQILDNHIGTDLSDTLDLGNGGLGIDGNSSSYFHTITGNVIAYNGSGLGHAGISFNNGSDSNNVIGNLIYSNAGAGVQLAQGAVADRISDNSIFDNGHLGIILGNLGVPLVNDACDPDTANNNQQNYPVITAATSTVNSVTIAGFLDSAPSQTYTLEFFANTVCDPSGFGEGETFIGATNLIAGGNCTNFFNFTFPVAVADALLITATATDPDGNTSEFSACITNHSSVATTTFLGPCPYLSFGNSPFGGLECAPFFLEDFEDLLLNVTGVVASAGSPFGPGGLTDSVDGDDGTIDGSGTFGHSFFSGDGAGGITFTFNAGDLGSLPTHVGIVWTDSGVGATILFEAFGPGNVSLGVIGPTNLAGVFPDGSNNGGTAEDRFFGVVNTAGISAIKISNSAGGIEVDHLQYGICTGIVLNLCPSSPPPVCSLTPPLATNSVGQLQTVTVTVTSNGVPTGNVNVTFNLTGANGTVQTNITTAGNGQASFSYTGLNTGSDNILAAGAVGPTEFACSADVVWINTNVAPQITCPANITTNTAAGICGRTVSFVANATGTPTPVVTYWTNSLAVTSPANFPKGITTVKALAINTAGSNECTFTVTVNDNVLPAVTCPGSIITNVAAGVTNSIVNYTLNGTDNCPGVSVTGNPPSGSIFGLGTTPVTVTAVDGAANTNTCTFNVTVQAAGPCVITCPADIVTNTALGVCGATVTFNVGSSGSCPAIVATPASGSFFNKGTNTVTVTTNGVTVCTFNVTVNDNEPPSLSCPGTITTNVPAGVTNAIVNFNLTSADDNCSGGSLIIDPPSGTAFPLGTNTVTVSMSDAAGNTNGCSFNVIVFETPPEAHDLALIKMKAPKNINLKGAEPSLTKFVKVTLQNRSPHDEVITNFTGLVTLVAESLGTNCPNATVVLHPGPPNNPKTLKPKQKMTVTLDVTWNCANDPLKGAGHEDFRYLATVHHSAIDGNADTHAADDNCPRAPLPGGVDPNPDGKVKDTGCAGGVDVKTDVFLKQ